MSIVRSFLTTISFSISLFCVGQSSVLSSGEWYKLGVTETGIYKIDRSTLDALGISSTVDPSKIKLYGNGVKGTLAQENSIVRPFDLLETPVYMSGSSDGTFDQNDYLLFYGVGPHKEVWAEDGFEYERNIYSDTAYYFIRVDGDEGKRIQTVASATAEATAFYSTFDDHITFEEDELNLISSGRRWLGEIMSNGETASFDYFIEGVVGDISCNMTVVNQSSENSFFQIITNGVRVDSIEVDDIATGPAAIYSRKAEESTKEFSFEGAEDLSFQVRFEGSASDSRGFIDRFALNFERNLRLYGASTNFRVSEAVGEVAAYQIEGALASTIWNVTDIENVYEQAYDIEGSQATFKHQSDEIEEYVVFSGSDFPSPWVFSTVENQNLKGSSLYEGIIITPPAFLSEANRLAQFHASNDGLRIKVVTPRQIYNEFSSGRQDVTAIRDYTKYVYDNGNSLKYLLLFGDCSYDYKDRLAFNTNYVPTYEARESFHPIESYSSDDFFAFLEDSEGLWEESDAGDHTMEIGVGRLPVKTAEEAKIVVDKIIYYTTSQNTLGKWRNEITYVADDGDRNRHVDDVEVLAELVDTTFVQYTINKLLVDAFEQEDGASQDLSPQASAALKTQIKEGTFVINFLGHGNENFWTEEEILTQEDIAQLTNRNKLPIFVTATCEFGRHDNPVRVSGAEELMLSETGGGIALLTTSRLVFASSNFSLNEAFHEGMFQNKDRLGDILRVTKNNGLEGVDNRNFALLGDPMMRPAFPKLDIVLKTLENETDTLSALEAITVSGEIQDNDMIRSDFNGLVSIGVYDDTQEFETRGQESSPYTYSLRSNIIFSGESTVENGVFEFSFVVPKNISYQFERGKMSLYAWDYDQNLDATGSSRNFVVGGTAPDIEPDLTPPVVDMFLNDESFVDGGLVGDSPILIAKINDESGITTSSVGVVEGVVLEIAGQEINLNAYYTASPNSFQEGTIVYPLVDLEPGNYVASLKVWDTHNNSSVSQIEFNVAETPPIFVFNEVAFPNPATDYIKFYFEHDREDEDLAIDLRVYNANGETLYFNEYLMRNSNREVEIEWGLTTDSGQRLPKGIYYYQLLIKSNFDGAVKEIAKKLVLSK